MPQTALRRHTQTLRFRVAGEMMKLMAQQMSLPVIPGHLRNDGSRVALTLTLKVELAHAEFDALNMVLNRLWELRETYGTDLTRSAYLVALGRVLGDLETRLAQLADPEQKKQPVRLRPFKKDYTERLETRVHALVQQITTIVEEVSYA